MGWNPASYRSGCQQAAAALGCLGPLRPPKQSKVIPPLKGGMTKAGSGLSPERWQNVQVIYKPHTLTCGLNCATMVLVSQIRQTSPSFPISTSWVRSSGVGTSLGIVSGRLLLLSAIDQQFGMSEGDVVFMNSSPASAPEHIHQYQPGIIKIMADLGQGESGVVLLEQAHQLARELCRVLIVDCSLRRSS